MMPILRRIARLLLFFGCVIPFCEPSVALAKETGVLTGIHGKKSVVPGSCRACHRGMRMFLSGEEAPCLACHGDDDDRREMERRDLLKRTGGVILEDIGAELAKPFAHPVLSVKGVHRSYEALPEEAVNVPRHAECVDCHRPHVLDVGKPFRGISGRRVGNFVTEISEEYELCFRCHSTSANLSSTSTDKALEFGLSNPSYHPLLGEGRNSMVVSLVEPYVARATKSGEISRIICSDCHGSNDPDGPRGPHGSIYEGLLKNLYEMGDEVDETEVAYALCYRCHDRDSILANESFPYHASHIRGNPNTENPGTSCFTCHDAHGSTVYPYLIRFNSDVVSENVDGKLEYRMEGAYSRQGACSLNCHGVEHSDSKY